MMLTPIKVEPRDGYRIWIEYSDGESGEVDLSEFAGIGVFEAWDDRAFFEQVHIGEGGEVAWGDDLDMCPTALYLKLTGKPLEEVLPGLKALKLDV